MTVSLRNPTSLDFSKGTYLVTLSPNASHLATEIFYRFFVIHLLSIMIFIYLFTTYIKAEFFRRFSLKIEAFQRKSKNYLPYEKTDFIGFRGKTQNSTQRKVYLLFSFYHGKCVTVFLFYKKTMKKSL